MKSTISTSICIMGFYLSASRTLNTQNKEEKSKQASNKTWALKSFYFSRQENVAFKCFSEEMSKHSINLWSDSLVLAAAKRWYSSKIEVRHHFCNFLRQPITQPVRCCIKEITRKRFKRSVKIAQKNFLLTGKMPDKMLKYYFSNDSHPI